MLPRQRSPKSQIVMATPSRPNAPAQLQQQSPGVMQPAGRSASTSVGATADRPNLMLSAPGGAIRPLHGVHDQTHLRGHPLQLISSVGGATAFTQSTSGSIDSPTPDEILPEGSDRQSPTVSDDNAASRSELVLGPDPRAIVPVSYAHAIEIIRLWLLDNTACKSVIKALKATGTQNAKLVTKLKILGTKMTQRQFSLATVLEYADLIDAGEEYENHSLYEMVTTKVRMEKSSSGPEKVIWIHGDVPVFDGEEVEVGQPALTTAAPVEGNARAPDFEASEYARILHVFIDTRMTTAIRQPMEPRTRDELERAPIDPWCDHIAPLFNEDMFKPAAISNVCGGVTRADIATIDPGKKVHERDGGLLKRKFAIFKSEYGTSVTRYEASGQGDPDIFPEYARGRSYLMYGFCFLKQHPVLQPLATRALQTDAQREEGFGGGVSPSESARTSARKRKREQNEIKFDVEQFSSAFKPQSEDVLRQTEEGERDKAKFQAVEAQGTTAQSLLSAIAQARGMLESVVDETERTVMKNTVRNLMKDLSDNLS